MLVYVCTNSQPSRRFAPFIVFKNVARFSCYLPEAEGCDSKAAQGQKSTKFREFILNKHFKEIKEISILTCDSYKIDLRSVKISETR